MSGASLWLEASAVGVPAPAHARKAAARAEVDDLATRARESPSVGRRLEVRVCVFIGCCVWYWIRSTSTRETDRVLPVRG